MRKCSYCGAAAAAAFKHIKKKSSNLFRSPEKGEKKSGRFFCGPTTRPNVGQQSMQTFFFKCLFLLNYKATLKAKIEYSMWRTGQGCQMLHIFSNQKSQFG
jgi:hypothetical protein